MNALTKLSVTLLLLAAATVGAYLYFAPGDEGSEVAPSQSQDATCKQDEERLARFQAHPSLDEGLSFVNEIRCLQLWPQLQTVMDGLTGSSGSTADPSPNAGSNTASASDAKPGVESPASGVASADDACKRDEDRLADLRASPSVDAAIRFDSELKCPTLQPQLPAILARLRHDGKSTEAANRTAPAPDTTSSDAAMPRTPETPGMEAASATPPDAAAIGATASPTPNTPPLISESPAPEATSSAATLSSNDAPLATPSHDEAAPPVLSPPNSEAASAATDDVCKQDQERLAELQAKPSLDEAVRFQGELKCSRLQPQLLAVLDGLSRAPAPEAGPAARTLSFPDTAPVGAAAPPALASPATEGAPAAFDDACKQDEERLARLRETPSSDEAARFARELRCETVRPQLLALTDAWAKPSPPDSGSVSKDAVAKNAATNETPPALDASAASQTAIDAERRIAALESEKEALAAKVSQLEHDREAASAEQARPPTSPQPAPPAERSGSDPASQAAVEAERRIAQLESQQEALMAKVSQLERDREASPAKPADAPAPPQLTPPPDRSESEAASQAAMEAERRIAELESEKEALTATVSRLEHDREAPSPTQGSSTPSPPLAAPTKRSDSEPVAALASLPQGMPGRVLIRYLASNADARGQAEKLARALAAQGVEVADLRESASAIRTELSFAYAPDEAIALEVGRLAGVAPMRRIQPKDGLMVRPGTVELSVSGDSHTAPIKTTLRRETNHE